MLLVHGTPPVFTTEQPCVEFFVPVILNGSQYPPRHLFCSQNVWLITAPQYDPIYPVVLTHNPGAHVTPHVQAVFIAVDPVP